MENKEKISKTSPPAGYVFERDDKGSLNFIGDFDSLYTHIEDPWGQSESDESEMKQYHEFSRDRLVRKLKELKPLNLLEAGCGLGYSTQKINQSLPESNVLGLDISGVAVEKAKTLFPNLQFIQSDLRSIKHGVTTQHDVIVMSHILWYLLEELNQTIFNCIEILTDNGCMVFSQPFLKGEQLYGSEICHGFKGFINFINNNFSDYLDIEYSALDESEHFPHNDGLIVLRKK
jgi:SAM-dependent methyltransferase